MKDFKTNVIDKIFSDSYITDLSFNGSSIFVQHNKKGRYKLEDSVTTNEVENYVKQLSYQNNEQFNDEKPILDTELSNMRINAVHKSLSPYGLTLSVRSSIPSLKINNYDKNIAPRNVFSFLEACIKANCNIVISGKTGSGKTELQKYLVSFIPNNQKIVMIEDTLDTRIKELYPNKDILSWKINSKLEKPITFDDLIKSGLRNNPDWLIISETRGSEAYSMLKCALSGHHVLTTLHSNNAKNSVERIIHLCKESFNLDQNLLGTMICDNFDLGIHLDHIIDSNGVRRFIAEVVEYISYGNKGTIVNPLFTRISTTTKRNGRFFYDVSYQYGKISEKLFRKLASYRVLSNDIEKFIKEEYYDSQNERNRQRY